MNRKIQMLKYLFLVGFVPGVFSQFLPLARLNTIFPPGGKIGSSFEVTVQGVDLDHASALHFSEPAIKATLKSSEAGKFEVTIPENVPPGLYEVRVVGRFGISTARTFEAGKLEEKPEPEGNDNLANAAVVTLGVTINGRSNGNGFDHFKFAAKKGQTIAIDCLAERIDSRMNASMVLQDSTGRELARSRQGDPIIFDAPADGDHLLKVHDFLFRGGPEYFYRLSISSRPEIHYILPNSGRAGARAKFQLFGRNLPGSELEVEIELPNLDSSEAQRVRLEPAGAMIQGLEYRLEGTNGVSNPLMINLASTPVIREQESSADAQKITPPCEFSGQLYPSEDQDSVEFEAKKGDVYWLEVFAHRLGLPISPFLLVQKVVKESISDVQEIGPAEVNIGGQKFKTTTLDPAGRFEVKEDGTYRVRLSNLFPSLPPDPANIYRLVIRKEAADFALIALPEAPAPVNRDTRPVYPWTTLLRKGEFQPVEVLVFRRDNFNGPIDLKVEGLPKGVRSEPTVIPGDSNRGLLFLGADLDAAEWRGPVRIVGTAKAGERLLSRTARAGEVLWEVGDFNTQPVSARLRNEFVLAVSETEESPLSIEAGEEKVWETTLGGKLSIPLKVTRRGEFNTNAKFKPGGHPALNGAKEIEISGSATNAVLELDLGQAKLPQGMHHIYLFGHLKGQYRKLTAAELKAAEEERSKGEAEAKAAEKEAGELAAAAKSSPEAAEKLKKAEALKSAATERVKQVAERIKSREVTAAIWSAPIRVQVNQAPQVAKK
jgi:hypothetical protein